MVHSRGVTVVLLRPQSRLPIAVVICLLLWAGKPSHGQTISDWIEPEGGNYNDPANWDPMNVPNSLGEAARFDLPRRYEVLLEAGVPLFVFDLHVLDGTVTFAADGKTPAEYNVSDTVYIEGGDFALDPTAGDGPVELTTAALRVSQGNTLLVDERSSATVTDSFNIGDFPSDTPGRVDVRNGSTLSFSPTGGRVINVGFNDNDPLESRLRITDSNSRLVTGTATQITIGANTAGWVEVLDGGQLESPDGWLLIAGDVESDGSKLTIDGGSTVSVADTSDDTYGATWVSNSSSASGFVDVLDGSQFDAGELTVRGSSEVLVDGAGSLLHARRLGLLHNSRATIQNGAELRVTSGGGDAIVGTSALVVTGSDSRLRANSVISVQGDSVNNPVEINVLDGATVEPDFAGASLELLMEANSRLQIAGSGSSLDAGEGYVFLDGGAGEPAAMHVADGATAHLSHLTAGTAATSVGHVQLSAGSLHVAGMASFGATFSGTQLVDRGTAKVEINPMSLLQVGGDLLLGSDATLQLYGGELQLADLDRLQATDSSSFDWTTGTVSTQADATLTPGAAALLTPQGELGLGKTLRVPGTLALQSPLSLNGGTLSVGDLQNADLLQLHQGRLEWEGTLELGPAGPLGEFLDLPGGVTVAVADDFIVSGVLTGEGRVESTLDTTSTGQLRIEPAERLTITARLTNNGDVQLQNGRLDVETSINNTASGNILGRGTISTVDGLTNQGDLALSNGQTDLFGDLENTGAGRVMVSGNADVTFWGDVVHSGALFNVSSGSSATFFGEAGFGVTGGGDVYFEADVSPGNSPGEELFGGNVHFGAVSNLEVELAGTTPGDEFDVLTIAGAATLDGTLDVSLLDGFTPELGDSFTFLTAEEGLQGTFTDEQLPDVGPFLTLETEYDTNTAQLTVVPALAGDFNVDGVVDVADYTVWRDTDNSPAGYAAWKANFGQTIASGSLASQPVPEPTSLVVAAMTMALLAGARRPAKVGHHRPFARRRLSPCLSGARA